MLIECKSRVKKVFLQNKCKNNYMRSILYFFTLLLLITSCQTQKRLSADGPDMQISWKRIPVNQTANPDPTMTALVDKYRGVLDEEMNQVVATSLDEMLYHRPESKLTNFTSDAMTLLQTDLTEGKPIDLAMMNVSGHRASIRKGEVTMRDLYSTYSFDNELVVLLLTGDVLMELFEAYAKIGGAGVSSGVKLVIGKDKTLREAKLNGMSINPEQVYTLVTLDYLAEGNDNMRAMTKALSVIPVQITLRDYMIAYVRSLTENGIPLSAKEDERIVIVD